MTNESAVMENTHSPGYCCCIATEVIIKYFNNFTGVFNGGPDHFFSYSTYI